MTPFFFSHFVYLYLLTPRQEAAPPLHFLWTFLYLLFLACLGTATGASFFLFLHTCGRIPSFIILLSLTHFDSFSYCTFTQRTVLFLLLSSTPFCTDMSFPFLSIISHDCDTYSFPLIHLITSIFYSICVPCMTQS